jgi:hypothetical protein
MFYEYAYYLCHTVFLSNLILVLSGHSVTGKGGYIYPHILCGFSLLHCLLHSVTFRW